MSLVDPYVYYSLPFSLFSAPQLNPMSGIVSYRWFVLLELPGTFWCGILGWRVVVFKGSLVHLVCCDFQCGGGGLGLSRVFWFRVGGANEPVLLMIVSVV